MTDTSAWTAPPVDRPIGPDVADERTAVESLLDYHRATLLWKCAGLTGEQLKTRATPPSTLSLLGLVRHMADVERVWFRRRVAGEDVGALYWSDEHPDADFDLVADADPAVDVATNSAEVQAARAIARTLDYDDTFAFTRSDGTHEVVGIRVLMLHMIEEYARHNGHADLLREAVDGSVGG